LSVSLSGEADAGPAIGRAVRSIDAPRTQALGLS